MYCDTSLRIRFIGRIELHPNVRAIHNRKLNLLIIRETTARGNFS